MALTCRAHFDGLCEQFGNHLPGLDVFPWDPMRAIKRYGTASHGERLVLAFLLGVWNPSTDWSKECKSFQRFDLFEAGQALEHELLAVIAEWLRAPRFP